jgi:hypothetical protein
MPMWCGRCRSGGAVALCQHGQASAIRSHREVVAPTAHVAFEVDLSTSIQGGHYNQDRTILLILPVCHPIVKTVIARFPVTLGNYGDTLLVYGLSTSDK